VTGCEEKLGEEELIPLRARQVALENFLSIEQA
jgi:hypothetical protein